MGALWLSVWITRCAFDVDARYTIDHPGLVQPMKPVQGSTSVQLKYINTIIYLSYPWYVKIGFPVDILGQVP